MATRKLSHVDPSGRPRMVDVGTKRVTSRVATAEARVVFPRAVAATLRKNDLRSAKGSIVDTAIIAGTMAVKRTHELIPFCHPLAIERCAFEIDFGASDTLTIRCTVAVTHKTGVEMEALTAAAVGLLTIYDMCKAVDRAMRIENVRLLEKSGGKSGHFRAQ
ncbi:MAG: cyclic pyranopterin monophosphate synthase MoaC [Rhodanobacteraceae bacterium]